MRTQRLNKDQTIHDLLAKLRERFGKEAFDIVDRWEADLFAVGVARRDQHRVLAYISTCGLPASGYFVELEIPPAAESDQPYQCVGRQDNISFDRVADLVAEHLGIDGA